MANKEKFNDMVVTSKKRITTEKGDGTYEEKNVTTLSDGITKITVSSVEENGLLNGETVRVSFTQNQKTLLEVKGNE